MIRLDGPLRNALVPVLGLVTAFLLGSVLIVVTDFDSLQHIGTDPVGALGAAVGRVIAGYGAMLSGAIGDPSRIVEAIQGGDARQIGAAIRPLTETLLITAPFIFVGLALTVSFRTGLINLGVDGQFLIGGFGAGITASLVGGSMPPPLALVVALAGGALFGAAYGFVPGFLKARNGAHEVITTLMLNVIAPQLAMLIGRSGLFGGSPAAIPRVPLIFDLPTIRLDYGIVAALVVAAVVSFLLFRTTLGFELRATGFSQSAARGAGMRPGRVMVLGMAISGGLVGLGSAFFALGPAQGLGGGPAINLGYTGLALALIAGLRPGRVVLISFLYGALNSGAKYMVIETGIPLVLLVVVIGLALMFVAAPSLIRSLWRLGPPAAPVPEQGT